ncbi:MAG: PepSY domain-containing protein [Oscillospiraceae bacterium]|nr:PepSY domain-containing protein [Oscillospiraceae bacterium]
MKKKWLIAAALAGVLVLGVGGVYAAGQVIRSRAIGEKAARIFVCADAGIPPEDAEWLRTEYAWKRGSFVYEVAFLSGGARYEYTVEASSGRILKKENEALRPEQTTGATAEATTGATAEATTGATAAGTTDTAADTTTEAAIGSTVEPSPDAARRLLDALAALGEPESVTVTMYSEETGEAYPAYVLEKAARMEGFRSLVRQTRWAWSDAPVPIGGTRRATMTAADGLAAMDVWEERADDGSTTDAVRFTANGETLLWRGTMPQSYLTGLVCQAYYELESAARNVPFGQGLSPEQALERYVTEEYPKQFAGLIPGNPLELAEYQVIEWEVRQIREDGAAVIGSYGYAFVPAIPDAVSADFGTPGKGEWEGKLLRWLQCLLERQEDGSWFCTAVGTGGFEFSPAARIGLDEAKAIALKRAGLTEAEVTFSKAKLEWVGVSQIYEIEFYGPDAAEYRYEVDGWTGEVRREETGSRQTGDGG